MCSLQLVSHIFQFVVTETVYFVVGGPAFVNWDRSSLRLCENIFPKLSNESGHPLC